MKQLIIILIILIVLVGSHYFAFDIGRRQVQPLPIDSVYISKYLQKMQDSLILELKNKPPISTTNVVERYIRLNEIKVLTNPDSVINSLNKLWQEN